MTQKSFIIPEREEKIDALIEKMTLHEKICQLTQAPYESDECDEAYKFALDGVGSFLGVGSAEEANRLQHIAVEKTRLGIPLIFGFDIIHGCRLDSPVPLAAACSFDDSAVEAAYAVAAKEARNSGINWVFAPMVDISRDGRWGRVAESNGEDPYLCSRITKAQVRGYQGDDISKPDRVAACVKHYAAYGACEGGRDYNTVDMTLPKFYEQYLPGYRAAVDAGVATVMSAFNDFGGVPCTSNPLLLKKILRDEAGFEGFVVSDWAAVAECVAHGTAEDDADAAVQCVSAGCDMDMASLAYYKNLEDAVLSGRVSESVIDTSVRRVLRIKYALGLFDDPYFEEKPYSPDPEDIKTMLALAEKSIVLLKNEGKLLPLAKDAKFAVVGNAAGNPGSSVGCWEGLCSEKSSLTESLIMRKADFKFRPCVNAYSPLDREALTDTVAGYDTVVAAIEFEGSGESESMCRLPFTDGQMEMLEELRRLGKKIITLVYSGRPVELGRVAELSDAVLMVWNLGTAAGDAIAATLFGESVPSGRLSVSFPHYSSEYPFYYAHPSTGRPAADGVFHTRYNDVTVNPLFPFGFGLSYTDFEYSDLRLSVRDGTLTATVSVTNTGKVTADETVQLYVHRRRASRVRPVKELKNYVRVTLSPGETREVTLSVDKRELGYYDTEMNYITDESTFDVWMAHDSESGICGTATV